jgi:hypothetical protein
VKGPGIGAAIALVALATAGCAGTTPVPETAAPLTFADVAPIFHDPRAIVPAAWRRSRC